MKKKGLIVFGIFLIGLFVFVGGISAQDITINYDDVISSSPEYYGSNIFWTDDDIGLISDRMNKSNADIFRLFVFTYYIENPNDNSDPNSINWDGFNFDSPIQWGDKTVSYSTIFETIRNQDLYVMVDIPYLAPWLSANYHDQSDIYSTYPSNNQEEYREFVYAVLYYMVNNAGISPDKIILEPFNEPDLGCGQDQMVHCFWNNQDYDDTATTFITAYNAAKSVSPDIKVVGMAEWDNRRYVRDFINNHNGLNYLDAITYHEYSSGYSISELINGGTSIMSEFGLPSIVDEYGSETYVSDGVEGALWNSYTLTNLLKNNIQPLQYPFSEFPGIGDPYESMGLFYSWTHSPAWELKPSFWVYSNIYRFIGNSDVIYSAENINNFDVLATKSNDEVNIVVTDRETSSRNTEIEIQNLPAGYNHVEVYDNFQENHVLDDFEISGNIFNYVIPSRSSIGFKVFSSVSSCGAADTNFNSIVEIGELMNYISSWKSGTVVIGDLMNAIGEWKNGC